VTARRVILHLSPDPEWLPLVEDVVRRFSARMRLSSRLTRMLAAAALEACDNLALAAGKHGVQGHCRISLAATGQAVTVELAYSGKIPLNPLAVGEYEVPDAGRDISSLNADALWLHLIKRRMDKVFFRVEGPRHVLSMVKYRRQEGLEGESWVMRLKPRFAAGVTLEIRPPEAGKPRRGILYNPATGVALKLGPTECAVVERLDGQRAIHDIYMEHIEKAGLIAPRTLALLHERLERSGMLQGESPAGASWRARLARLTRPDLAIPRSDAVITALHARLRWLVGPFGAGLLTAVGASGLYPLLTRLENVPLAATLEALSGAPLPALAALYLSVLVMAGVHELAHGLVCKHFGGRVQRMGVVFSFFVFVFYCDITSAHALPRTGQKVLVSLAGPLTTFAFFGLGLWMAAWTADTDPAWSMLWRTFSFICLFGLSMNANPFLKMDAYAMLTDILGIERLRERSFAFLRQRLFSRFAPHAAPARVPAASRRERLAFWCYGLLGTLVSLAFIVLPVMNFGPVLLQESASRIRMVVAAAILFFLFLRLGRQVQANIASWRNREYRLH
jgi:putative peptide zinc metalloprotease protein